MGAGDACVKFSTALKLGRVSNLPTIWTNTLVGLAFASTEFFSLDLVLACVAFSLFYVAGMYLNDAFDAKWDARHQVKRPIPLGEVTTKTVVIFACVFLFLGWLLIALLAQQALALLLAFFLTLCILLYDWKHKQWPVLAPWLMGCCRLAVYAGAASLFAVSIWSWQLWLVAGSVLLYIAGITALARAEHVKEQENKTGNVFASLHFLLPLFAPCAAALALGFASTHAMLAALFALAWIVRAVLRAQSGKPGCIGQAVAALLAGIAAIDAAFLFALNEHKSAAFCLAAFVMCLLLQKKIAAT